MDTAAAIRIQVNGEIRVVPPGQPIAELIADLGLLPGAALVEYNGQAILRSEWAQCRLAEGDVLEIMRVVAGG